VSHWRGQAAMCERQSSIKVKKVQTFVFFYKKFGLIELCLIFLFAHEKIYSIDFITGNRLFVA